MVAARGDAGELKAGDIYVSKFGTNLRLTVTKVLKNEIHCKVERRVVDRKTGEISVEERDRIVDRKGWPHVAAGYVLAR